MLDHLLGGKEDPTAGSRPLICGAVAGGELGWDPGGREFTSSCNSSAVKRFRGSRFSFRIMETNGGWLEISRHSEQGTFRVIHHPFQMKGEKQRASSAARGKILTSCSQRAENTQHHQI